MGSPIPPEPVDAREWAGAAPDAPGPQHAPMGPGPNVTGQLLAAQLQALQLGAGALPGGGHPPSGIGAAPAFAHGADGSTSAGQHQLDAALLGGGDLFARLQMAPMLPLGAGGLVALPGGGMPLPQHLAAAAALQQQQQQQQQRGGGGAAPGRRRGGGGRRNEEKTRRTVYISDISDSVSEAHLASFFADCGQLVDCRVCGDPNSSMRFAFIEFVNEEAAQQALGRSGAVLGDFPIRVSPSKTAIVPVNNTYLPRSTEERELVARTVFVGNVDRVVEREQLREFFENLCGPVAKIRLLGDTAHASKIAFIEFATAESARGALKLSGALLGTLPLRVSPSKTPVRVDSRRNGGQELARSAQLLGIPGMHAAAPVAAAHHHQLNPALLMAVAGFSMPAGFQAGHYN